MSNVWPTTGCVAWRHHRWLQLQWDVQAPQLPIVIKEMLLIVIAAAIWGHEWQGHLVTDLASRTRRLQQTMHLYNTLPVFLWGLQWLSVEMHSFYSRAEKRYTCSRWLIREQSILIFFEGTGGQPTSQRTASCIDGSTPVPTTGLGLAELDSAVQLYYQHGLADSTHQTYTSSICKFYQFYQFCTKYPAFNPFLVTERLLCYFAVWLVEQNLDSEDISGCS